ncbi:MAG TPA: nucleotide exchange factor GrpE [Acidimicrobiales bacterium]|nr:nucleotide exchange factor GrpE [Acidimicrobiales bacterium]
MSEAFGAGLDEHPHERARGGAIEPVETEVEEDVRTDVERERDEYLDALRRLQADFENYRKRVDRQFDELAARGQTALVTRLLPVLDALDLAEEHLLVEEPSDATLSAETKALVQARALLLDTLAKDGLERAGAVGEPFDPTVHDAVAHVEGEDGPVVDEVLRAGYRWRGQVLRPAMVRVRG